MQQWKRNFESTHLYLLFSIRGFTTTNKFKIWAEKNHRNKILLDPTSSPQSCSTPCCVSTAIMSDLEPRAHFGCSTHCNSAEDVEFSLLTSGF